MYWLRITAVAALIGGAVWFLLPTFLQESAEERLETSASGVHHQGKGGASLDVEMPATGDPAALARALQKRLQLANVKVASVTPEATSVKVKLSPGTAASAVTDLAVHQGVATLYPPTALLAPPTG